jgi:hypothetical protein
MTRGGENGIRSYYFSFTDLCAPFFATHTVHPRTSPHLLHSIIYRFIPAQSPSDLMQFIIDTGDHRLIPGVSQAWRGCL